MGLFDKKFCDICGEKIGLLGNRKLEDGNMCKDCARMLSPFFTGRKKTTVNEIKEQLLYREKNKVALSSFVPSVSFGENYNFFFDFAKGSFVVSRKRPSDWDDENPDVIALSAVYSCNGRIEEETEEIYAINSEGDEVSYSPPRYKTLYDFYITLNVNHPFFDEIEVKINDTSVEGMGTMEYNRYAQMSQQIVNSFPCGGTVNNGSGQNVAGGQPMAYYNQPQNMGYQPNPYGQQIPQNMGYAQPNPYAQPNVYTQPNQYAQPNAYAQPGYGAYPNAYSGQQPLNQQPMQNQGWTCRSCNSVNTAGNFCAFCGATKNC